MKFCQGIQKGSPVDSFALPVPAPMPGYESPVVMAAGTFIQGASLELSCDGPVREPYLGFLQGGLTFESGKLGVLSALSEMLALTHILLGIRGCSRMPFPRKITPQQTTVLLLAAFTGALIAFLIPAVRYFRTLTGAMAVSNASDLITQTVSNIVENEMRLLGPDGGKFVSFEKDGDGQISAIVTDTSRVNILSAELLNAIVEASDRGGSRSFDPLWKPAWHQLFPWAAGRPYRSRSRCSHLHGWIFAMC